MTRRAAARRNVTFRVVASALMLTTVATAAELIARGIGADIPAWKLVDAPGVVMTAHTTRLWGLNPGAKENAGTIATVNSLGLRGPEPELPKPAGRLRVFVVGDSTWFGHGVADDSTFAARLEALLRADGLDVDVLNGGVPGYSTEQSRLLLEELGWSLSPDLLVVGSLWSDNNVDPFQDQDLLATARAAAHNPLFASHAFRLLASAVDRVRGGTGGRIITWTHDSQYPEAGTRRVSLQRYAENLDWMAREARTRGAGVLFVAPCNIGQVDQRYPDGASWDVYFDAQAQVAAHHGVPRVETVDAIRAAAGDDLSRMFVDVMHPSAEGQAVFAAVTRQALRAAGWPEVPLLAKGAPFPADRLQNDRLHIGRPNPSSPQRNLFGPTRAADPPPLGHGGTAAPAPDEGREGQDGPPPPLQAASGDSEGARPGDPGYIAPEDGDGRWMLEGRVSGATGSVRVEVRAPGGGVVASARLLQAGGFGLRVRADLSEVDLVLTDDAGATLTRRVRRGEKIGTVALDGK